MFQDWPIWVNFFWHALDLAIYTFKYSFISVKFHETIVYLFYFVVLVVFLRNPNYANVGSPFSEVNICHFLFLLFQLFVWLLFIFSVIYAPYWISQRGHSALGSFQFHISFSFPESSQLIFHLVLSHDSLSLFISALHSDCPFLKCLQQNISSHLLLGKIFLVGK